MLTGLFCWFCWFTGIVLLKNEWPPVAPSRTTRAGATAPKGPSLNPVSSAQPLLPLNLTTLKKLCVIGPLANSSEHMMGNYYGAWDESALSPLQALQEALGEALVTGVEFGVFRVALMAVLFNQRHKQWQGSC